MHFIQCYIVLIWNFLHGEFPGALCANNDLSGYYIVLNTHISINLFHTGGFHNIRNSQQIVRYML